jgi:hypothetical protein
MPVCQEIKDYGNQWEDGRYPERMLGDFQSALCAAIVNILDDQQG